MGGRKDDFMCIFGCECAVYTERIGFMECEGVCVCVIFVALVVNICV